MKKIKFALYSFFILSLLSCDMFKKNEDPVRNIKFKGERIDLLTKKMIVDKIILPKEEGNHFYLYPFKTDSLNMNLRLRFNPDEYGSENLRQIKIYLNGDTIYNTKPIYLQGLGSISIKKVENIIKTYNYWYGKYDTIIYPDARSKSTGVTKEFRDFINQNRTTEMSNEEKTERKEKRSKTLIWYEKNFDISIFLPEFGRKKYNNNIKMYDGATITYSMKRLDSELAKIKDSIREILQPLDIIELEVRNPSWKGHIYTTNLTYNITGIYKKKYANLIPNKVLAIRYDLIIEDLFKNELARIPNSTFELKEPLTTNFSGYSFSNPYVKGIKYNIENSQRNEFEEARLYAKNNSIKIKAIVTSVLFGNGEVLN